MDEDIVKLLQEAAPENVEDLETVEQIAGEIEGIYSEMKHAIEEEKKEKITKLEKALVKRIIALFNAGYSIEIIRELMERLGIKHDDAENLIDKAWEEMEKKKRWGKWLRILQILIIVGIIGALIFVGIEVMHKTKANYCTSYMCISELMSCKSGKYTFSSAGTVRDISVVKNGNSCFVRIFISKSEDKSKIGEHENCVFKIVNGVTNLSDKTGCTGDNLL